MKRKLNKILIGLITLTMIVSSTGLAFAGEMKTGIDAEKVKSTEENAVTEDREMEGNAPGTSQAKVSNALAPSANGEIKALKGSLPIWKTVKGTALYTSAINKPAYVTGNLNIGYYTLVEVIAEEDGLMYMDAYVSGEADIYLVDGSEVYNVVNANDFVYYDYMDLNSNSEIGTDPIPVTKNNSYYIVVSNSSNTNSLSFNVRAYMYTTKTRNLAQGSSKWTLASDMNRSGGQNTTYFKVTPNMTGVMTVSFKGYNDSYYDYAEVTLLNSSKKALSTVIPYNKGVKGANAYFGVKKNTTYYLKVTNCVCGVQNQYGIKYTMTARTDRSLSSKSSAKKLTRYADATNTLFVASTGYSSDWYKFYVTSKRKTVVRVDATAIKSGELTVRVYCGSKYIDKTTVPANYYSDITITNSTTYEKANKGTYYVKVTKSPKASGKYLIKYKQ